MTDKALTMTVRLNYWERSWLMYLARRGGESRFNRNLVQPRVRDALDKLAGMTPCPMTATPVVGAPGEVWYRLTDVGRNLCDLIAGGAQVKV